MEQVILVPLLNGMFGRTVHAFTWFGAIVSLIGIGMLECTGSPPNVSLIFVYVLELVSVYI